MGATIVDIVSQQKLVEQRIMSTDYINQRANGVRIGIQELLQMVGYLTDE